MLSLDVLLCVFVAVVVCVWVCCWMCCVWSLSFLYVLVVAVGGGMLMVLFAFLVVGIVVDVCVRC